MRDWLIVARRNRPLQQRARAPRSGCLLALAALVVGLAYVATNVARTAQRSSSYPAYWQARLSEAAPANALRLVALGDSSVQAIGADDPMDGYVGRIANYLNVTTGHPVHIANVSSGSDTASIARDQLPRVNLASADLVIVADSNDLESRVPLDRYRGDLRTLMALLPPDRTIYSDLPLMPGRQPYQRVLAEIADAHGIARADFAGIFSREGRRLDIFSWLPPHLNSRGYGYWFKAFQPQVDVVLRRMPRQPTSGPTR